MAVYRMFDANKLRHVLIGGTKAARHSSSPVARLSDMQSDDTD